MPVIEQSFPSREAEAHSRGTLTARSREQARDGRGAARRQGGARALAHVGAVRAAEGRRIGVEEQRDRGARRAGDHRARTRLARAAPTSAAIRAVSASSTARPRARRAVVAPPLVVERRIGPLVGFLEQAAREHPLDGAVERARAHADRAVGDALDLLHDGVAMPILVGQRQQDVGDGRRQRQEVVGIGACVSSYIRHGYRIDASRAEKVLRGRERLAGGRRRERRSPRPRACSCS